MISADDKSRLFLSALKYAQKNNGDMTGFKYDGIMVSTHPPDKQKQSVWSKEEKMEILKSGLIVFFLYLLSLLLMPLITFLIIYIALVIICVIEMILMFFSGGGNVTELFESGSADNSLFWVLDIIFSLLWGAAVTAEFVHGVNKAKPKKKSIVQSYDITQEELDNEIERVKKEAEEWHLRWFPQKHKKR